MDDVAEAAPVEAIVAVVGVGRPISGGEFIIPIGGIIPRGFIINGLNRGLKRFMFELEGEPKRLLLLLLDGFEDEKLLLLLLLLLLLPLFVFELPNIFIGGNGSRRLLLLLLLLLELALDGSFESARLMRDLFEE